MHRSMHRRVHRRMHKVMACAHGGSCKRGSMLTQHSVQLRYFLGRASAGSSKTALLCAEHTP
jgi:hypothetical protein